MSDRKLYLGPLTDNRRWDRVRIRPGDVILVTPPKSGTTWMQSIIALLLSGDPEVEPELATRMPWVDIRLREVEDLAERLEAMEERRCLKSHTPMDGLPLDPNAHYICLFRHPLDLHFSFRKHRKNLPLPWFDHWYPDDDPTGITFRRFLDGGPEGFDADALTLAHILRHYRTALELADRPNVTLFHYADMKADLAGTFDRVAALLGVAHAPQAMAQLVQAATFDNMKKDAQRFSPLAAGNTHERAKNFFDSGSSGKWQGQLSAAELAAYEAIMAEALTPKERAWLEWGAPGSATRQPRT